MIQTLLGILASGLILCGTLLCLVGAIGLIRLPDCYSRMHSASKAGSLGASLVLVGVAAASSGEMALEAIFAVLVLLATAPLAAHAVSRSAHRAGHKPKTGHLGDALANHQTKNAAPPAARS